MTVHLLKLAVGAGSVEHLRGWAAASADANSANGVRAARITTRMAPKRAEEVLRGGSLYWVVKGTVAARQAVMDFTPVKGADGIGRVGILLCETVVPVRPRPCRPFQGWRYLACDDAPADIAEAAIDQTIPPAMRRELMELCLI